MERMTGSSVTVKATLYKLALDQGVFAPLFQFPVLTYIGFLQGQNFADIKTKIRSQWWDIVTTGRKVSDSHCHFTRLKPKRKSPF